MQQPNDDLVAKVAAPSIDLFKGENMLNSERQAQIKAALSTAAEPLSASSFARQFAVSRQTIVGDIALLRAQGEPIIATPR
ncbi:small molecule binding protein, 3H domain, partial [Lacticaseibacillus paracasei subsp. paracasei CNCM I-4648]